MAQERWATPPTPLLCPPCTPLAPSPSPSPASRTTAAPAAASTSRPSPLRPPTESDPSPSVAKCPCVSVCLWGLSLGPDSRGRYIDPLNRDPQTTSGFAHRIKLDQFLNSFPGTEVDPRTRHRVTVGVFVLLTFSDSRGLEDAPQTQVANKCQSKFY